jgi:branched-chain amino acid transport system substrate-binding protein
MVVLALVAGGCGKAQQQDTAARTQPPVEKESIKIGGLFALTGKAQHIGEPSKDVAMMMVERLNSAGGVDGHPIELVIADTKSEPSQAVVALKRLVEKDQVKAVIGPTTTGSAMACLKTIEQAGIPVVACVGGTAPVQPVRKWVFKTPQTSETAVRRLYEYLRDHKMQKAGLLVASDKFGQEGGSYLQKLASEYSIELVAQENIDPRDTDMTVQLTKVAQAQPDAIVVWTIGPAGAVVARNISEAGIDIPLFQCHGQPDPIYIRLAGDAADGSMMPSTRLMAAEQLPDDDPQKPVVLDFIQAYKDNNLGAISTHSGYAWDAVQLVFMAMQQAGTEPAAVRDALENTENYIGVSGIYNMSPDDHCGLDKDSLVMVKVEDGQWKLLE